jgi:exodeoxyribonuclease-5
MSITLTDSQFKEVKKAGVWYKQAVGQQEPGHFWFAGSAGTGKTTVVPHIIDACGLSASEVAFMAPSGKASKVLTGKLRAMGLDAVAKTIHSSIYRPKSLKAEVLQHKVEDLGKALHAASEFKAPDVFFEGNRYQLKDAQKMLKQLNHDLDKAYISTDGPTWQLNAESPIRTMSLIVTDESSMINEDMAADIKSFGIPVIAIGDPGQLPPVMGAWGFCGGTPDALLTEIHRQAAGNPIIALADFIRKGGDIEVGTWGDTVKIIRRKEDDETLNMDLTPQIICGTNKKRWSLTQKIRKSAGYDLVGIMEGEPLLCRKNSRTALDLVNGTFLTCDRDYELVDGGVTFALQATDEDGVKRHLTTVQALFEEHYLKQSGGFTGDKRSVFEAKKKHHHVDWGWCITAHISQGSQWDHVIVHDESGVFRDDSHRWLYTAVTRAAEKLTVVI